MNIKLRRNPELYWFMSKQGLDKAKTLLSNQKQQAESFFKETLPGHKLNPIKLRRNPELYLFIYK